MKFPLLALTEAAPPGFESRLELLPRELRRGVFALYADSLAPAEAALEPFRGKIAGLVVTAGDTLRWQDLGRGVHHLGVPASLHGHLPQLLQPYLALLERLLDLSTRESTQKLELARASEDRARLVREFGGLRESLLREIAERRAAQGELQTAHDELESRVQARTAELAETNEALQTEVRERRRAARALVHERQRFNTLMETVPDSIYFKDAQSRFLQVNRSLIGLFKLHSPKDAIGKTDFDFFDARHAQAALEDEQEVMRTGQPIIGKVEREILPDGTHKWALTTKMPLRDTQRRIIGTFGVSRDITEMKRTEDELRAANARLEEVLADLTRSHEDLKRAQLDLIHAEKMQSVGTLAAGVAHEVKNPLAILNMGLECLDTSGDLSPEDCAMILKEMREAVSRANGVISGLLDFSSSKELRIEKADLNAVVENGLRFMKHEVQNAKVTIVRALDPRLPHCRLDPHKIEQVFINLFINSCHATPEGGTITVTTGVRTLNGLAFDSGDRAGTRVRQSERAVFLEIHDTGPGIPPDKMGKVFDPFFTTKPTGKGTGLGLTVAQKIIELHDGRLELANAPEGGALATVLFKLEDRE